MMRSYGKVYGFLTIAGDILKVMVAIWIAFKIVPVYELKKLLDSLDTNCVICLKSFAGLFAVIGHIFPCFLDLRAERALQRAAVWLFL